MQSGPLKNCNTQQYVFVCSLLFVDAMVVVRGTDMTTTAYINICLCSLVDVGCCAWRRYNSLEEELDQLGRWDR